MNQSTNFQQTFDLIQHIEEVKRPYRANNSELSDIDFVKFVLHGNHAAFYSRANLPLSLKTNQHSSSEFQSAVIILKQVFTFKLTQKNKTENFSSWKISK